MKTQKLFSLLIVASGIALIQGCKLERVDPPCITLENLQYSGGFNDIISIKGDNFIAGSPELYTVSIAGNSVPVVDVPDSKTLRFKVPSGIGNGTITISPARGTICSNTNTISFIYELKVIEIKLFASGFKSPSGMDVDAAGNVIVADKFNNEIKQITPAGEVTILAGNGIAGMRDNDDGKLVNFNTPEDVAVDAAGNIYVADYFNHCIRKIATGLNHHVSTAAGVIGVSGDNVGTASLPSKLDRPKGVAVNGANNILTAEYIKNRLCYISFTNKSISTLIVGSPALNFPTRVAYSEKRNPDYPILICDWDKKRILEVNTNRMTKEISLPFKPQDIAIDENGNIIVLDKEGRKISVIHKDNSRKEIAGVGINYDFKSPSGLAIDTKNKIIYISDESSNNIVSAKYE